MIISDHYIVLTENNSVVSDSVCHIRYIYLFLLRGAGWGNPSYPHLPFGAAFITVKSQASPDPSPPSQPPPPAGGVVYLNNYLRVRYTQLALSFPLFLLRAP